MPTATSSRKSRPKPIRYQAVADDLRRQIVDGDLQIGDKLPSYQQLYDSQGVATYTVERAYSVLESEGLVERRARSGVYVAPPSARRVQDVVGLMTWTLTEYLHHPYFTELVSGAQEALERAGVNLMLIGEQGPANLEEKVGGVLLFESAVAVRFRAAQLPPEMPTVSMLERCGRDSTSSVIADDYDGGRQATKHLLALGHRRIAYLTEEGSPIMQRRVAAYCDALQDAGIEANAQWRHNVEFFGTGHDLVEAGHHSMQQWLQNDWQQLGCTALLCQNDEVAAGAMQALGASGVLVPQDVSVLGFDDQRICTLVSPNISTVRVPLRKVGARAAELLLEQMRAADEGNTREVQSVVLPVELLIRDTTVPRIGS